MWLDTSLRSQEYSNETPWQKLNRWLTNRGSGSGSAARLDINTPVGTVASAICVSLGILFVFGSKIIYNRSNRPKREYRYENVAMEEQ